MNRLTVPLFLVSLLLAGCGGSGNKTSTQQPEAILPVETVTVASETVPIWLDYTGMTKASSDQEVRARVSGRLEKIFFEDGQKVKAGEKLFLIEQTAYKAALDAAKADKERDEASLRLAKANVDRYRPLVGEGLAPQATLDEYDAQYAQFEAAIAADNAKIRDAQLNLSYTVVTAPVSGSISARLVDVGNLVGYGEATLLTTIMQTDPLYVYFSPAQEQAAKITRFAEKPRLNAYIELPSSDYNRTDERFNGYVDFSNNSVDPQTSTLTMRATLANPKGNVLPGTFVYVHIFVTDRYQFIMVPPQALFEDQLGPFVYTVGPDGKAVRTSVTTGFSNRYYLQIRSGLKDGDRVVISGLVKVHAGIALQPKDVTDQKGVMAVLKANDLIPKAQ